MSGRANVTWLNEARHKIAEYETEATRYAAGEIDGEPTYFDGYPFSGLNRVIVQHGMQQAKLGGHSVHAVSGLPVSAFYLKDGSQRAETVEKKRASLKQPVDPIDGRLAASIAFHDVIPEALAAWYDHVITDTKAARSPWPRSVWAPPSPWSTSAGAPPTTWSSPTRPWSTTPRAPCAAACWT